MTCTCPSGDGSLRWPCPEHMPPRKTDGPDPRKRVEATRLVSDSILPTNQQRARDLWRRIVHAPDTVRPPDVLAAALDAAEARGRAEMAAKVEALADVVVQDQSLAGHRLARRLRRLAAEVTR